LDSSSSGIRYAKAVDKAKCANLSSDEQNLKEKYKGNEKILKAIEIAKQLPMWSVPQKLE
jgi:hypothetical protein